jgi:hypothetical protein
VNAIAAAVGDPWATVGSGMEHLEALKAVEDVSLGVMDAHASYRGVKTLF